MKTKYITIEEYQEQQKLVRAFETCKIPYNKTFLIIAGIIASVSIITPFTNFFLIPLAFKVWRKAQMEYPKPKTKRQALIGIALMSKFRNTLDKEDMDIIEECIKVCRKSWRKA